MKKCVVSFADNSGDYQKKMIRLENSLKGNFDGDFLGFTSYNDIDCEPHSVIPYKFKPASIKKAIDKDYDLILWCDSPVVAIKNIQPVFDHIKNHGYLFFDNIGHSIGRWTNDRTLSHFNIKRGDAMNIQMIMACCMGFYYFHGTVVLFSQYQKFANVLYPGAWTNQTKSESEDDRCNGHRHDQSVMSCIINRYGLTITKAHETFFMYEHFKDHFKIADSVCLVSR